MEQMENVKKLPTRNFNEALQAGLNNMKDFEGRARRSEFWWFMLAAVGATVVEFVLFGMVMGMAVLSCIVAVMVMFGCLSVTVRRLHDAGRNGMWAFGSFFLQVIALLIMLFVTDGGALSNDEMLQCLIDSKAFLVVNALDTVINVFIVIFCLCDSKREENDYGESNKYVTEN